MFAGVYIYPYRNKILPLIMLTGMVIFSLLTLLFAYDQFWDILRKTTKAQNIINQIAIVIGIFVGAGYMWREYYRGELSAD